MSDYIEVKTSDYTSDYVDVALRRDDVVEDFEFVYHQAFEAGVEFAKRQVINFIYINTANEVPNLSYDFVRETSYAKAKEYFEKYTPLTVRMVDIYANDTTKR